MIKSFASLVFLGVLLIIAGFLIAEDGGGETGIDLHVPSPSPTPGDIQSSPSPTPYGGQAIEVAMPLGGDLSFSSHSSAAGSLVSGSPTPIPITPEQEVSGGFTRYIPDNNGDMEWKLEGETVKFLTPTCLEIMAMTAYSLSPEIGYLKITAGKVLYYTDSKKAQAEEERITVRRENMVLTGSGFLWSPNLEQIRVAEDVKVLIKEKGNMGLFPL